jgi:hypothetical protein
VTGLALANASNQATTLTIILRNDSGMQIGTETVPLEPHGHTAPLLSHTYGATMGIGGTLEIDAPSGIQFSALGIRFMPTQNVTTIPLLAK